MKVDPEDPDRLQTDSNNENKHPHTSQTLRRSRLPPLTPD